MRPGSRARSPISGCARRPSLRGSCAPKAVLSMRFGLFFVGLLFIGCHGASAPNSGGEAVTPHAIVEGMARVERALGDRFEDFFHKEAWEQSRGMLAEATDFAFGAATRDQFLTPAKGAAQRARKRLPTIGRRRCHYKS